MVKDDHIHRLKMSLDNFMVRKALRFFGNLNHNINNDTEVGINRGWRVLGRKRSRIPSAVGSAVGGCHESPDKANVGEKCKLVDGWAEGLSKQ